MILNIEASVDNRSNIKAVDITDYSNNPMEKELTKPVFFVKKVNTSKVIDKFFGNSAKFINIEDGYHKVYFVLIPTKQYKETHPSADINIFMDGDVICKEINLTISSITVEELGQINLEATNLIYISKPIFNMEDLKQCYVATCKLNLKSFGKCGIDFKSNVDFIWITLNIIHYLIEFEQYLEADKILTLILGCNGLCKSRNRGTTSNRCGCTLV